MKHFIVYNNIGEVLRTGSCNNSSFLVQATKDENIIEGQINLKTHKIVNHKIIKKTNNDKIDYRFNNIKNSLPPIDNTMSDVELDNFLTEYFTIKMNISKWRIKKYAWLRKKFYPSVTDYIDAQVKKKHNNIYGSEGSKQETKYLDKCVAVKLRFPKS